MKPQYLTNHVYVTVNKIIYLKKCTVSYKFLNSRNQNCEFLEMIFK